MFRNRSIPQTEVIPVLAYPDVTGAAAWLIDAFGFSVRVRVDGHRVQMNVGEGAVILRELRPEEAGLPLWVGHSVTVRVLNTDTHCRRARAFGAQIAQEPATFPYGERQYVAVDLAGHSWTFSESVADRHPAEWGGQAEEL